MLTSEQKNQLVDNQVKEYEVKIFQLEMNRAALVANDDHDGAQSIDKRIGALRKAIEAVSGMKEG